jgi:D-tyrosyl-tRNA(Tyr) deacylase
MINGKACASIGKGLLIFLGIEKSDQNPDINYMVDKIINLRIFENSEGKMNHSVLEIEGEILIISQFTLLGDCRNGRRPSFTQAENHMRSKEVYEQFVEKVKEKVLHVSTGEFQAMMNVEIVNNGPVTIMLDSRKTF